MDTITLLVAFVSRLLISITFFVTYIAHQTANALSFVIYNLARNPDKQEALADEISSILRPGVPVTADAIQSMSYLKACVKESYRYVYIYLVSIYLVLVFVFC